MNCWTCGETSSQIKCGDCQRLERLMEHQNNGSSQDSSGGGGAGFFSTLIGIIFWIVFFIYVFG